MTNKENASSRDKKRELNETDRPYCMMVKYIRRGLSLLPNSSL